MPPKTIKMALADVLENLSRGDFEKFCYQLLDRRQEPRVKRNKVEDKSRLQVTDVLVSHFTEEGALQVALDILQEIGCSDEAKPLETLAGGQSSKPGPSDASGGAAGGCKMADGEHFVDKHRLSLTRRVSNISPILDELYDKKVVVQEAYERIRALTVNQDKMREIYKCSMNTERAKDIFYEVLSSNEKFLIEELSTQK